MGGPGANVLLRNPLLKSVLIYRRFQERLTKSIMKRDVKRFGSIILSIQHF